MPNSLLPHCQALAQTFACVQPVAPAFWGYETTSAISKAVHFGQLTPKEGRQALETLALLDVRLLVPGRRAKPVRLRVDTAPQARRGI